MALNPNKTCNKVCPTLHTIFKLLHVHLKEVIEPKLRDMVKMKTNEQLILEAANKVFKEKGYDGTTVQDIADAANTTKSMVNYYFRSKEKLFGIVFKAQFQEFYEGTIRLVKSDLPLYDKIVNLVEDDTEKILKFPLLPIFILNEINRNPSIVFSLISESFF
jgi:AcrR family transcriptional regulator